MKLLLAIAIATFTTAAHAQCYYVDVVWVPVQCGPGGCCPPCPPPQYYTPPRTYPRPSPDGQFTQPAPEFEPNPPKQPTPPSVPPVAQPPAPKPPAPTVDPDALRELIDQQKQDRQRMKEYGEQSLLIMQNIQVAIEQQKGCQCDNSKLEAKIDALIVAVKESKQPAPGVPAQTEPQIKYWNIVPRKN